MTTAARSTRGRIVVRNDLIVCSRHGDSTEATTVTSGTRITSTRWTCVECGATRWTPNRRNEQ